MKNKDYESIALALDTQHFSIKNDDILQNSLSYLIDQVRTDLTRQDQTKFKIYSQILLLFKGNRIFISEKHHEYIIESLCLYHENNLERAYTHAISFPNNPICQNFIIQYKKTFSKPQSASDSSGIKTTFLPGNSTNTDYRCSIFKSKTESIFFDAARRCFPNYYVFPNIAMSTIFNFDIVKNKLTQNEKDFFLRGLIDCAIIDMTDNYKSKYLFEIDSKFHESDDAFRRDSLKNSILSKLGVYLLRITPQREQSTTESFVTLIQAAIGSS